MKLFAILLFCALLFAQCKPQRFYRFSPAIPEAPQHLFASASKTTPPLDALIASTQASFDSTLVEASAKPPVAMNKRKESVPRKYLIQSERIREEVPTVPRQPAVSQKITTEVPSRADVTPNALAHVSFFSAIGLVLLYLFLSISWPLGTILAIGLPVIAIVTGIIALKQIKKRHEMGKHLAIFGISIGAAAMVLLALALIFFRQQ